MPKDPWIYKRRKRRRRKTTGEVENLKRSRISEENDSMSRGLLTEEHPVKKETFYPDTQFEHSTTLFPAAGPIENDDETFDHCVQNEQMSMSLNNSIKLNDLAKTSSSNISEDIMIIEKPKTKIKIELIDLIDQSSPIVPILCSPVRTGFMRNRLPGKIEVANELCIKLEETNPVNAEAIVAADINYHDIQPKNEQNQGCHNNEANFNKSTNEPSLNTHIKIKTEKNNLSVNNAKVNFETSGDIKERNRSLNIDETRENIVFDSNMENSASSSSIFSNDSHAHKTDIFQTPILKYLNCNTKIDIQEISLAISVITKLIEEKETIQIFDLDFTKSQDKCTSPQLEKSVAETQMKNSLNNNVLGEEIQQILFESPIQTSVVNDGSDPATHTTYFNTPMDIENQLKDDCSPIIVLPSLLNNNQIVTSNNLPLEEKRSYYNELVSSENLHTFHNSISREKYGIGDISFSRNPVVNSMNDSVYHNHQQIDFHNNKPHEIVNSSLDVRVNNLDSTLKNLQKFSKDFKLAPDKVHKQKRDACSSLATYGELFETPPKRIKISENTSISKNCGAKKVNGREYKEKYNSALASPSYPSLAYFTNGTASDFSSNASDSSPGSSYFQQNIFSPLGNHQHSIEPICCDASLQYSASQHQINTSSQRDPGLVSDVNIQKLMESCHNDQTFPSQSFLNITDSFIYPYVDFSQASERNSFSITPYNPHPSVQVMNSLQPRAHFQLHHSLPKFEYHHPGSSNSTIQTIRHLKPSYSTSTHDQHHYSSVGIYKEFDIYPPLPDSEPPPVPPPPPTSPEFTFVSLIPKQLREHIGNNIVNTNDIYLIIIEKNIDWIKEVGAQSISDFGCELKEARDFYKNHLDYYNTFFPFLLLECFTNISSALKGAELKGRKDKNVYKFVQKETKENYVSITCDSFVCHSDMDSIPRDGHIILLKFATVSSGSVKMLGYVCYSGTRKYSPHHDKSHEILKYINMSKNSHLRKIKITFYTVFSVSNSIIDLSLPFEVYKLTNIKKTLLQNDALKELARSPLCNAIINPRNQMKSVALPRRLEISRMCHVQLTVQSLSPSPELIVFKTEPNVDNTWAIVETVSDLMESKIPGKILVCVRKEKLSKLAMILMHLRRKLLIINRDIGPIDETFHKRTLDLRVNYVSKAKNISSDSAKARVLQEAEVLLVVTDTCFYEDVKCMAKDITYCVIYEANKFTEPESLLPLMCGIKYLFLFGNPEESCQVNSKYGASLGYDKSLFHRVYKFC